MWTWKSKAPLVVTVFLVGAMSTYLKVTSQSWSHPVVVLIVGLAITAVMYVVTRAQDRALAEAEMTSAALRDSEEALRESEERTRLTLAQALDAVITGDAEGRITGWNPHAEGLFGWTRDEAIGRRLSETIIPPAYREAHERGLARFVATGEGPVLNRRIEVTALHRNGTEFPIELAITPMRVAGALVFVAFLRDITERTRADQVRRESEAKFRLLFAGNPLAMWVYEIATLRFLEVNVAAVQHYGFSREEFLRMRITDIRPPEDFHRLEAVVARLAAGREDAAPRQSGAWRHRLKDGRIRDVDIVSEAIEFDGRRAALVVAIDVTELKQTQASLARSTQRLEILHEIDRALIAQEEPVAIAQAVLWRLRDLLGVGRAIVNLFDLAAGEAEWLAAVGRRRLHVGPGVRFSLSLMGDLDELRRGRRQVVDVRRLPESTETKALLASGVVTYMVVPMLVGDELIGGLSFGGERSEFPPDQVAIAQEAATQLAIAIVQARLRERVRRQAEELEQRVRERTLELSLANAQLQREIVERRRATAEATRANEASSELRARISYELRAPMNAVLGLSHPGGALPADIRVLVFTIDGQRWALPAAGVERVLPMVEIVPLPGGPPIARGAINVHGVVVPVVDVRRRLSLAERAPRVSDHLVLVRAKRRVFAMPVDEALGVSHIPLDVIVQPGRVLPALRHVAGVVALDDGLLLVQDLDAFLSLDEERALEGALEEPAG